MEHVKANHFYVFMVDEYIDIFVITNMIIYLSIFKHEWPTTSYHLTFIPTLEVTITSLISRLFSTCSLNGLGHDQICVG
jgi:hypothetical protein